MKKVFISHSYKDKELLQEFIKSIKLLGNQVFFSSNSHSNLIPLGKNMFEIIRDEIKNSDIVIAIISHDFYESIPCQIEMGISYAFNKNIIPLIVIENINYSNILKGIFNTHNRASCIYNKDDIETIFAELSSDVLLINDCVDNVMKQLKNNHITKTMEIEVNSNSLIKDILINNEFNTNETIFIKYIVENRKFEIETGWQTEDGIIKFQKWLKDTKYYIKGDITEFYNNTIKYFNSIKIIEKAEYTCHGNIKLYKIKQEHLNDIIKHYNNYKKELDKTCNLQYIPF